MAGHGSRFSKAGYRDPKPLISVGGKPMIELVIDNLTPQCEHRFFFICQSHHLQNYPLRSLLEARSPGCVIIEIKEVTEGAACTVLLAKDWIQNSNPLMIANCDQFIAYDINRYLSHMKSNLDGLIMTMHDSDKKWSYIELNGNNEIVRVVEKEVVSNEATVGIYNYQHGLDFVEAAQKMIDKNIRVNNEFYVAPVYNEMIAIGKKIGFCNIGFPGNGMYGLGTPEDLNLFLKILNVSD